MFEKLVRKGMDVYEHGHGRLSNITLRHILKQRNSTFIAVLPFTVAVAIGS